MVSLTVHESIRDVTTCNLADFYAVVREYLPDTDEAELHELILDPGGILQGYYKDECLIGVAYGAVNSTESFRLIGIAIVDPYRGQGRGSRLLQTLEKKAYDKGYRHISLGSADGYAERFYLKNGYSIESLKILSDNDDWKTVELWDYPLLRIESQGKYTKLVIQISDYERSDKVSICESYGGCDSFYVFEKCLGEGVSMQQ